MNEVFRDERVIAVENASYKVACNVVTYGLLLDAAYRGLVFHQNCLDLLVLVIAGGSTAAILQARQRILGRRWILTVVIAVAIGALIAIWIAVIRRH